MNEDAKDVDKTTTITYFINCITTRPTPPHKNPMEPRREKTF